jgi:hypothetical protein
LNPVARRLFVVILLTLLAPHSVSAQGGRTIAAVRTEEPPAIDGDLSDICWQGAPLAADFTNRQTGEPPSDQTEVRILYDSERIYIAFTALDSQPDGIVARETKRGVEFEGEDYVAFAIDPMCTHSSRGRFTFEVNALGTQYAESGEGRARKVEWEGEWYAAAAIREDGWTAELSIPWTMLHVPASAEPCDLCINFTRRQERTNIRSQWSNIGPQGRLEFDGIWQGVCVPVSEFERHLDLLPFALFGWSESDGLIKRGGLDAKMSVTPMLTAVATANPDFSNVEEAVESIDFSYSERYVPDLRPFFAEGGSLFGAYIGGGPVLYTERIPSFDAGAKIYGNLSKRVRLATMGTFDFGSRSDTAARVIYDYGPRTNFDVFLVDTDRDDDHNRVVVATNDWERGDWILYQSWGHCSDPESNGDLGAFSAQYEESPWEAALSYSFVDPEFRNLDGFVPFTDFRGWTASLDYDRDWENSRFRGLSGGITFRSDEHYDGTRFRRQIDTYWETRTRGDTEFSLDFEAGRFEEYDDYKIGIGVAGHSTDYKRRTGLEWSFGRLAGHSYTYIQPTISFAFGESFYARLSSEILRHKENEQQHVLTLNYDFGPHDTIAGRLVKTDESTNWYLSYRHSGLAGTEFFIIVGDPNADTFQKRLVAKVVWPL